MLVSRNAIAAIALGLCCAFIGWAVLKARHTVSEFQHEFFGRPYAPLPTSVHVPSGLKRITCPAFRRPGLCFTRERTLILNPRSAARLALAAGVPASPDSTRCLFTNRRTQTLRRLANNCEITTEITGRKVIMQITSVFMVGPDAESAITEETRPLPLFWVAIQSFGKGSCHTHSLRTCSVGHT
jgi:hypothetical protein